MTINMVEKLMTGSRKNRRRKLWDLENIVLYYFRKYCCPKHEF